MQERDNTLDWLWGTVTDVADGDTFTLKVSELTDNHPEEDFDYFEEEVIRIRGIDAVEKGHPLWKVQKRRLEKAALNRDVRCQVHARDDYGRLVCDIWVLQPSTFGRTLKLPLLPILGE